MLIPVLLNYNALQWELLKDANIWKDAATQMFFTLSLGFGALIAFASYMPIHNQVMRDAYTVVFVNCGTSLFAGIVVFSILGYREHITGIPVTEVRILPKITLQATQPFKWAFIALINTKQPYADDNN